MNSKYHNHFVAHRGQVLQESDEEYGGVTVSFPPKGSKSDQVTIKEAKDCLEGAKKCILKIVEDLVRETCDLQCSSKDRQC